jgi:hypothetical protein
MAMSKGMSEEKHATEKVAILLEVEHIEKAFMHNWCAYRRQKGHHSGA